MFFCVDYYYEKDLVDYWKQTSVPKASRTWIGCVCVWAGGGGGGGEGCIVSLV